MIESAASARIIAGRDEPGRISLPVVAAVVRLVRERPELREIVTGMPPLAVPKSDTICTEREQPARCAVVSSLLGTKGGDHHSLCSTGHSL